MSKNILNLLLATASFAIYYLVINPLYSGSGVFWQPEQSISSLRDLNNQYTTTLSQASSLYNQAESLRSQYKNVSEDAKQKMELMVPDKVDPVRLLNEVTKISNEAGLTLKDLGYVATPPVLGTYGSYTVSFTVTTTYAKFKELMHYYEVSLRLFKIKNVVFAVSQKDENLIEFQVKLETYYMK